MPAPIGNQNARKGKLWQQAILRALEKRSIASRRDALDDLAEKLLSACDEIDVTAIKELGDRLDGKPAQTIQGDADNPLTVNQIIRRVVDGA